MRKLGCLALAFILLFASLPALAAELPSDGQYMVAAILSGGSGRASVASPAKLTVQNGAATATVVWSSPYYEYMLVNGETYYPIQEEGNSTFEIPVLLDTDIAFSAQTAAMSEPHVIEYTLRFDSKTLEPFNGGTADILVWLLPILAFALAGAVFLPVRRGKRAKKGERQ
ncbi:MAG TPA: hypothetical protein VN366_09995 [Feifaniaceae bacterium]|nr:hypothetical protein [Feifaniaceae bacterium]